MLTEQTYDKGSIKIVAEFETSIRMHIYDNASRQGDLVGFRLFSKATVIFCELREIRLNANLIGMPKYRCRIIGWKIVLM